MMDHPNCLHCGGTGDRYDFELDDWVSPIEPCPGCNGSGDCDGNHCDDCARRVRVYNRELDRAN